MGKLCESLFVQHDLKRDAVIHGQVHEEHALQLFMQKTGLAPLRAGLFINTEHPFLAATPDAIEPGDYLVEIKCPYAGRTHCISPGPLFPCLEFSDATQISFQLKTNHKWYHQIQGQMACTKIDRCFFVIYTFADVGLFIEKISFDRNHFNNKMLPKLVEFYESHWRPFLAKKITDA